MDPHGMAVLQAAQPMRLLVCTCRKCTATDDGRTCGCPEERATWDAKLLKCGRHN